MSEKSRSPSTLDTGSNRPIDVGIAYVKAFRRFNVVGGFNCVVGVESDDEHCVSFGCVVACHTGIISIVSAFVNPFRHLFGKEF